MLTSTQVPEGTVELEMIDPVLSLALLHVCGHRPGTESSFRGPVQDAMGLS